MFRVLIAVDGSEHTARAIDAVGKMARSCGDLEATLVHVSPGVLLDPWFYEGYTADSIRKLLDDQRRQQDSVLARATEQALARNIKLAQPVRGHGPIAKEIVNVAKQQQVDQIAMGTRGLGAVASMLMGSVAQQVLIHSPVPVLLVR